MEFLAHLSGLRKKHIGLAFAAFMLALLFNLLIIFVCFWSFNPDTMFGLKSPAEHAVYSHPIMLSNTPMRLPRQKQRAQSVSIPLNAAQPPAPIEAPEQEPASGHKLLRAGTSLDAPDTDHALGLLDRPGFPDGTMQAPAPQPEPAPAQPTPPMPTSATNGKHTRIGKSSHAELDRVHTGDNMIEAPIRPRLNTLVPDEHIIEESEEEFAGDSADTGAYAGEQQQPRRNLDFLSPEHMHEAVRQGALNGRPAGTRQQYGEMKYLHYNRRVYQAMQESMNIAMHTMRPAQYRAIMQDVRQPTRVRFCLNANGKLERVEISASSGSPLYDQLTVKIIEESSFPPIPKSFGLERTYFNYGIILYEAEGAYEVGVSPYLEGE